MRVSDIQLTNFQLKQLFEEFNAKLLQDGISAKYSWFMYKNCFTMAQSYSTLMQELFDERKEDSYLPMIEEQQALVDKYCDKDEHKQPILDAQQQKVITKHITEYNTAFEKLREKYKELFEKIDNKNNFNQQIYSKTVVLPLTTLDLSEFPPNTKPYIVGILGY